MNLKCESKNFNDYLLDLNEVDYSNPIICTLANELFNPLQTEIEKAKAPISLFAMEFPIHGISNPNE